MFRRCTTISELMINEQIRDREVRLIGQDGEQLGVMPITEAMKLAREAELDLICSLIINSLIVVHLRNAARKFIEKGNKVKVTLRFRGREMAHVQSSKQILDVFSERMADVAVVDKAPKMEGRSMTMFLTEKR